MRRFELRPATLYAIAVLCAVGAILVRASLNFLWGDRFPYLAAYPAILIAAWLGGLGPGLVTTALCAAAAVYFWIPPTGSFLIAAPSDLVALVIFVFIGGAISVLNEVILRREQQLDRLLESISDGFIVLDHQWRYRFVNDQAAQLMRRPRAELLGKHIWSEFPDLVGSAFEAEARRAARRTSPGSWSSSMSRAGSGPRCGCFPRGRGSPSTCRTSRRESRARWRRSISRPSCAPRMTPS